MIEEYKVFKDPSNIIKGQKNLWEISNYGNVRKNGVIINNRINNSGYYTCCHFLIHRLVAEYFIGNIPDGYVVDHIDGNKLNNHVNNLKICTQKDNINNPISYKRMLHSRNTDEYKKKQSDIHKDKLKGKIHINNGEIEKFIYPHEFEEYSKQGFILGCLYDKYIKLKNTCKNRKLNKLDGNTDREY